MATDSPTSSASVSSTASSAGIPDAARGLPRTRELLEDGLGRGLHPGAQLYVSLGGEPVADLAVGEARPGEALTPDHLTLWLSSTKPTAAVALAVLWERGLLALDDPVARHLPEFGQGGKERVTLRHLLTHTAGVRMLDVGWPREDWDAVVARVCAKKLEPRWTPGEKAGYHLSSSWFVLGEVVRRLSGRPYPEFLRQEVFEPLGMGDSWVGMPVERFEADQERLAITWNTEPAASGGDPTPHRWHDEAHVTRSSPGGNGRGPARELGRFYEFLLDALAGTGDGPVGTQTVEALVARHRVGLYDHTFRHVMDWGLGFIINSAHYDQPTLPYAYGPHASRRAFGHSGYRSSTGFADPEHRLAVALVTTGTPSEDDHRARMEILCASIYEELDLVDDGGDHDTDDHGDEDA